LTEVGSEKRTGYRWYVYDPKRIFDKYQKWQKKYALG
jgi:hypothetical protein